MIQGITSLGSPPGASPFSELSSGVKALRGMEMRKIARRPRARVTETCFLDHVLYMLSLLFSCIKFLVRNSMLLSTYRASVAEGCKVLSTEIGASDVGGPDVVCDEASDSLLETLLVSKSSAAEAYSEQTPLIV